jgi:hypothetical protein
VDVAVEWVGLKQNKKQSKHGTGELPMKELFEFIYDLITEFDEMGFVPTTTIPEDPEVYAIRWRDAMIEALQDLSKQSEKYLIKENGDILPLTHQSEWISVEDRLPDKGQEVLAYRGDFNGDMMNTYTYLGRKNWEDDYGYRGSTVHEGITHWMPLPEPPKMKGGAE